MSFHDLMTSAKGPGVIGLLLALVVLGGFMVLGTLTLDERFQGGPNTLRNTVRDQQNEIASYRGELENARRKLVEYEELERGAGEFQKLLARVRVHETNLVEKQSQRDQIRDDIAMLEQSIEDHKKQYRNMVREAARGSALGSLTTLDGETMHDVTIRQVSAIGMDVSHRDGAKRIPFDILPMDLQQRFLFDSEESKAVAEKEMLDRQILTRMELEALESNRSEALRRAAQEQADLEARNRKTISALRSRISTLATEIRSLEYEIRLEESKTLSRAPAMKQQLAEKEALMVQLENNLRSLVQSP